MLSMLVTLPAADAPAGSDAAGGLQADPATRPVRRGVVALFIAALFALAGARTLVGAPADSSHCATGQRGGCAASAAHARQP